MLLYRTWDNLPNITSGCYRLYGIYRYPARMFINEDFPAPLGPMIAVNCPELNFPVMHFKIVLKPAEQFHLFFVSK